MVAETGNKNEKTWRDEEGETRGRVGRKGGGGREREVSGQESRKKEEEKVAEGRGEELGCRRSVKKKLQSKINVTVKEQADTRRGSSVNHVANRRRSKHRMRETRREEE